VEKLSWNFIFSFVTGFVNKFMIKIFDHLISIFCFFGAIDKNSQNLVLVFVELLDPFHIFTFGFIIDLSKTALNA